MDQVTKREFVIQKFNSHEEADEANVKYMKSLTPEQRLEIFFELNSRQPDYGFSTPRHERVVRIIEL